MATREQRRKRLEQTPQRCVRGYKDSPMMVEKGKDPLEHIEQHIMKILIPAYHHTLQSIDICNLDELEQHPRPNPLECSLRITTSVDGDTCSEEISLPVHWRYEQSRSSDQRATLQIRTSDMNLHTIMKMLDERGIDVTQMTPKPNGADLQVTDAHRGVATLYLAKKRFGGSVRTTRTLAGTERTTGDKKYTITALYRSG